jgi:hypothetical protein
MMIWERLQVSERVFVDLAGILANAAEQRLSRCAERAVLPT